MTDKEKIADAANNVCNCGSIFKNNHTSYKLISKEKI